VADPHNAASAAALLLQIVGALARELHPRRSLTLTLDGDLERDFGLDSLSRVELALRIERAFGVRLPEPALVEAATPHDLLQALLSAAGGEAPLPAAPATVVRGDGAVAEAAAARTLIEVLEWHAAHHGERTHAVVEDDSGGETPLSFAELRAAALRVAAGLTERGVEPGDAVAIMLPTGIDYLASFFGVLYAGAVPVPLYPPTRAAQLEEHSRRHTGILASAGAVMLITFERVQPVAALLKASVATLRGVVTAGALRAAGPAAAPFPSRNGDLAFIQYTSGSTGDPKGVMLAHANLLANIRAMGQALRVDANDVFVSWLPLYHDMGLIGAWLGSLYYGFPLVLMSPLAFLARPRRWFAAIDRHGGTLSGAPNFAYELSLRLDDATLAGLDLSSWRFAFNGAEAVSAETMLRFGERFARYGLRREALAPVYGLAECSVGLTFPPPGRGLLIDRIDRSALAEGGRALPAAEADGHALRIVSCGRPLPEHEVRIVDAAGREVAERQQGRIEFKGPSATRGYYRDPTRSAQLLRGERGEWLDSGDLGYVAGGELYITGRAKDIIIRGGRNIYPQELERAVGELAGVRRGCVVAFGSTDPATGSERLIVLAETRAKEPAEREALRRSIHALAIDVAGIPPDDVVLAPPHTVLKTSSGKLRRAASRALYEAGTPVAPRRSAQWQLARLGARALLGRLRRALAAGAGLAYSAWVWALLVLLAPPVWAASVLLARSRLPWTLSRLAARGFLRMAGLAPEVNGLEHLPPGPCVVAVNHASYLDGVVLVATLPRPMAFVAKAELLRQPVLGRYLGAIGARFVERFDARRGVEDTGELLAAVRGGDPLLFFPEGTFRRMPGLLPFRMGTFKVAADAGVAVVPAALRGTRSVLRDGSWLPRRAPIAVTFAAPVQAADASWQGVLELRDAVRARMLELCGEPDLALERVSPPPPAQRS